MNTQQKYSIAVLKSMGVDDYDVEADGAREQGFTSFLVDRSRLNKNKWIITSLMQLVIMWRD